MKSERSRQGTGIYFSLHHGKENHFDTDFSASHNQTLERVH